MSLKSLFFRLISTECSIGALVTRVTLGACMLPHGWEKLHGFKPMMKMFTEDSGIPAPFAFLVILAESFGAAGLLFGVIGRFCAFGIECVFSNGIVLSNVE